MRSPRITQFARSHAVLLLFAAFGLTAAQGPSVPRPVVYAFPGGGDYERSIATAPNVSLNLCVVRGELRINGWRRNEVRVYVKDGSRVAFNVRDKSPEDGKPIWINAIGQDPHKVNKAFPECLWGERIEIDLPLQAYAGIKGQEVDTRFDSIRKVEIQLGGGDITARNISAGVTARTYEGDIIVESSTGPLSLETTSGNITAFEVAPAEIGDRFRAKTVGGAILLEGVSHRQLEVNSVTGSVAYKGDIRPGGSYSLSTSLGSIRLSLPPKSAFYLTAIYGYGTFVNELPWAIDTENISPGPIKQVAGKVSGGGDASLRLSTNNGSIIIRKN